MGDRPARASSDLPTRLLQPLVEPGAVIGGARGGRASASHAGTPVVAPACHDTGVGGRVGRRPAAPRVPQLRAPGRCSAPSCRAPIITARARELNFTNEGGVCGTTRLLKNIAGLWLLQACRRSWASSGQHFGYDEAAGRSRATSGRRSARCSIPTIRGSCIPTDMAAGDRRLLPRRPASPSRTTPGRVRARDSREPRVQVPRRPRIARRADRTPLRARFGSSAAARATGC